MQFSKTLAVAAGAAAAFAVGSAALAQTPPPKPAAPTVAPPAAPTVKHGPAIPGLCYYSFDAVFAKSAVGKAVIARMTAINKEVEAELTGEQKTLIADIQAFDKQRATMTPDAVEQKDAQLQLRRNALARKADLRQRELQATQGKAVGRVEQEMIPVVLATYQARNCSVLFGTGLVLGNPAMDISDQVVTGLNAKIQTFTFNRERLDTPPPVPTPAPAPK